MAASILKIPLKVKILLGLSLWAMATVAMARDPKWQRREQTESLRQFIMHTDFAASAFFAGSEKSAKVAAHLGQAQALTAKFIYKLSPTKSASLTSSVQTFEKALAGSDAEVMFAAYDALQLAMVKIFGPMAVPSQTPDLALGERVYQETCAACHGSRGTPPAAIAEKLKPPPASFTSAAMQALGAPRRHFNVIYNGMGVGQQYHNYRERLMTHELWSAAFYLAALPYVDAAPIAADAAAKLSTTLAASGKLNLEFLAGSSDRQLLAAFPEGAASDRKTLLPFLRLKAPAATALNRR